MANLSHAREVGTQTRNLRPSGLSWMSEQQSWVSINVRNSQHFRSSPSAVALPAAMLVLRWHPVCSAVCQADISEPPQGSYTDPCRSFCQCKPNRLSAVARRASAGSCEREGEGTHAERVVVRVNANQFPKSCARTEISGNIVAVDERQIFAAITYRASFVENRSGGE